MAHARISLAKRDKYYYFISMKGKLWVIPLIFISILFSDSRADTIQIQPIENISNVCGKPKDVQIQFTNSVQSVKITIKSRQKQTLGLFNGWYRMFTSGLDGTVIESAWVVPSDICTVPVGCSKFVKRTNNTTKNYRTFYFYNTTDSCGLPRTLIISFNGNIIGKSKPEKKTELAIPAKKGVLEVLDTDMHRLFVQCVDPDKTNSAFFGCTNPFYKEPEEGVKILFSNNTNYCPEGMKKFLTLWVDNIPVKGLAPGKKKIIKVSKGSHRIKMTIGLNQKTIIDRLIQCKKPFMLNYGCKKK